MNKLSLLHVQSHVIIKAVNDLPSKELSTSNLIALGGRNIVCPTTDTRHNAPILLIIFRSTERRRRCVTRRCHDVRIDRRGASVHPRRAICRGECRRVRPSARYLLPHHSERNVLPGCGNNRVRSKRLPCHTRCDNVCVGAGPCTDRVGAKPGQGSVIAWQGDGPCIVSGDGGPHVACPLDDDVLAWQVFAVEIGITSNRAGSIPVDCKRGGSVRIGCLGFEVFCRKCCSNVTTSYPIGAEIVAPSYARITT